MQMKHKPARGANWALNGKQMPADTKPHVWLGATWMNLENYRLAFRNLSPVEVFGTIGKLFERERAGYEALAMTSLCINLIVAMIGGPHRLCWRVLLHKCVCHVLFITLDIAQVLPSCEVHWELFSPGLFSPSPRGHWCSAVRLIDAISWPSGPVITVSLLSYCGVWAGTGPLCVVAGGQPNKYKP